MRRGLWLAVFFLVGGCATVPELVAEGRLANACLQVRPDPSLRAEHIGLIREALRERIRVHLSFEEVPSELLLPADVRLVRIDAEVQGLPRRGRLALATPFADGRPALAARIVASDYEALDVAEVPVPERHVAPEYEPRTRPPRLHYVSGGESLSGTVNNAVRGWLSLLTLGAMSGGSNGRRLTPASAQALERWRRANEDHHQAWAAEQSRLAAERAEERAAAQDHNVRARARLAAHTEAVERAVESFRGWPQWRCNPIGVDQHMSRGARCTVTVPMRWLDEPIALRLEGDIQLFDEDARACEERLEWQSAPFESTAALVAGFSEGRMLGEVAELRQPR